MFTLIALSATLMSLLFGLLLCIGQYRRRYGLHPELARKGVHVLMGLACLPLPWLPLDAGLVTACALLLALTLLALRLLPRLRRTYGAPIYAIGRPSVGELCFPAGIALVYGLAQGDPLFFCLPLLLLSLADPAAALVGTFYRRRRYHIVGGTKSLEGSLAFFGVVLVCAAGALLLAGTSLVAAVLVAVLLGLVTTLIENLSWRGLDNLLVPLGSCVLLMRVV